MHRFKGPNLWNRCSGAHDHGGDSFNHQSGMNCQCIDVSRSHADGVSDGLGQGSPLPILTSADVSGSDDDGNLYMRTRPADLFGQPGE